MFDVNLVVYGYGNTAHPLYQYHKIWKLSNIDIIKDESK